MGGCLMRCLYKFYALICFKEGRDGIFNSFLQKQNVPFTFFKKKFFQTCLQLKMFEFISRPSINNFTLFELPLFQNG